MRTAPTSAYISMLGPQTVREGLGGTALFTEVSHGSWALQYKAQVIWVEPSIYALDLSTICELSTTSPVPCASACCHTPYHDRHGLSL